MQLTSKTDLRVGILYGPVINMKAGVPTEVPDELVAKAKTMGCTDGKVETPKVEAPVEPKMSIEDAMNKLLEDGDESAFDAHNRPRLAVLKEMMGVKVTAEQRDQAWEQVGESGQ